MSCFQVEWVFLWPPGLSHVHVSPHQCCDFHMKNLPYLLKPSRTQLFEVGVGTKSPIKIFKSSAVIGLHWVPL